ncbi:hypothetical protein ACH40D_22450 [Streptomyces olivaceoviridis]|uniref:Uncharacterized protein n=1 Tax=Streptomyces olivaceoviridis TaxID=1921 RepID=A0ABW7VFH5_STROI|nr:hypothetical protein [Streptomyces corchorusii]
MYLVIELWKASRPVWRSPLNERHAFLSGMGDQLTDLRETGGAHGLL